MEQYVVTGVGIYNNLGKTANESWDNLLEGKSAVKSIVWPEDNESQYPRTHNSVKKTLIGATSEKLTADDQHPKIFNYGWFG